MQVYSTSVFIQHGVALPYRGRPCASLPARMQVRGVSKDAEALRLVLNKNKDTRLWLPALPYRLHPWSRLILAFPKTLGIQTL